MVACLLLTVMTRWPRLQYRVLVMLPDRVCAVLLQG